MTINFLFVGARLHVCIYIYIPIIYVIVMKICFVIFNSKVQRKTTNKIHQIFKTRRHIKITGRKELDFS